MVTVQHHGAQMVALQQPGGQMVPVQQPPAQIVAVQQPVASQAIMRVRVLMMRRLVVAPFGPQGLAIGQTHANTTQFTQGQSPMPVS